MDLDAQVASLGKLGITAVLCALLGWERESLGKAAGLRTHILVGIGAAFIVMLAEFFVVRFQAFGDLMRFDPVRAIEAVATGVSFLGAGTIVFAKGMDRVRGLTTAASLWATAGVGMATALELYVLSAGATLLLLVVLRLLLVLERISGQRKPEDVGEE